MPKSAKLKVTKKRGRVTGRVIRGIPYSKNITIIDTAATRERKLQKNEYFALMVIDSMTKNDTRKFFNEGHGWLGLEYTSPPPRVYIAKNFYKRYDLYRGVTMVVRVKDPSLERVLD